MRKGRPLGLPFRGALDSAQRQETACAITQMPSPFVSETAFDTEYVVDPFPR